MIKTTQVKLVVEDLELVNKYNTIDRIGGGHKVYKIKPQVDPYAKLF